MNRWTRHRVARQHAAEAKARPIHHSPWFWVGTAMFLTAILTYVFSEDLSLRPRVDGAARTVPDKALVAP